MYVIGSPEYTIVTLSPPAYIAKLYCVFTVNTDVWYCLYVGVHPAFRI